MRKRSLIKCTGRLLIALLPLLAWRPASADWQLIPGTAQDVAVGADGTVWIVDENQHAKKWLGGDRWEAPGGGGTRIAVDPQGMPWVVNAGHEIYRREADQWLRMPGQATDIAAGADGSLWITGVEPQGGGNYDIRRWDGRNWERVSGIAVNVAVAGDGTPWVVQASGSIFRRSGSDWQPMPGLAADIGAGANDTVWVLAAHSDDTGDHEIFEWNGTTWEKRSGGGRRIAVDPFGSAWVVNASHQIWSFPYYYRLGNTHAGPRVSLDGTSLDSNPLHMYTTADELGQLWQLSTLGNGFYRITSPALPGKSLDSSRTAPTIGDTGGFDGQLWTIVPSGDGTFRLSNRHIGTGRALDSSPTEPMIGDTGNFTGQQWRITRAVPVNSDLSKWPRDVAHTFSAENWMADLAPIIANRKLSEVVLPGSHDAGTYDFPHGSRVKNQNNNMWGQLAMGVRLLDLRTLWGGTGTYVMHHGGATSADSTGLNRVLDDIAHFAKGHPKELLLLDFHTSMQPEPHSYDELVGRWLLWRFTNDKTILAPSMLPCAESGQLGACTLQDVWDAQDENRKGNVVIIIRQWQRNTLSDAYKGLVWTAESLFDCGAACEKANPPGGTNDYTTYTETDSQSDHFRTLGRFVDYYKTHERPANKFWLMYAQRLGGCPNPEACARTDNPKIIGNLDGPWRGSKLNVISADFVGGDMIDKSNLYDLPGAIIRYNLHR